MVLAIMVILFGLLFAPMMTSIDMATTGRNRARMQDGMRLAIEQIKRDLVEAMFVFPPETVRLPGVDAAFGTADDQFLPNYSTLTIALPARDDSGQVIEPLRLPIEQLAGLDGLLDTADDEWLPRVVRFAVHTPTMVQRVMPSGAAANLAGEDKYYLVSTTPHAENPFVMYRQEGWARYNAAAEIYEFGSYGLTVDGGSLAFIVGRPDLENALSPTDGADFSVSTTISLLSGAVAPGYVDVALNVEADPRDDSLDNVPVSGGWSAGDVNVVYIHSGVQFTPLRVAGEWLTPAADGVLYRAAYGNWLGYQNDGSYSLADALAAGLVNNSELAPRIKLMRYSDPAYPGNPPYASNVVLDSGVGVVPAVPEVKWEARAGAIRVGHSFWATVTVIDPEAAVTPGSYFSLAVTDSEGGSVSYGADGSASVSAPSILSPIYPNPPATVLDAAMPIAFDIDPTAGGSFAEAKLVRDSLRVWVEATYASTGVVQRIEFSPTSDSNQENIGAISPGEIMPGADWWWVLGEPGQGPQFCPYITSSYGTEAEVRFNRWRPPSPQAFGPPGTLAASPAGLRIHIIGTMRRNFDPVTYEDDRVVVSYATPEVMNIALQLQRYQELTDIDEVAPQNILVPEATGTPVAVRAQVRVRNLGR